MKNQKIKVGDKVIANDERFLQCYGEVKSIDDGFELQYMVKLDKFGINFFNEHELQLQQLS